MLLEAYTPKWQVRKYDKDRGKRRY